MGKQTDRRRFLKTAAAAVATAQVASDVKAETREQSMPETTKFEAAPCGLYCGVCADKVSAKECHGCGCDCGECGGKWHSEHCAIAKCSLERGLGSCAGCPDLPCTRLIEFTFDPIWRTHVRCIENLRRRREIGTAAWLKEQEAFWRDDHARAMQLALHDRCAKQAREFQETGTWTG